jgi:hypothetical protein
MWGFLSGLLGLGNAVSSIASKIAEAQVEKAKALTDRERIAADERIKTLEMQRDILISEQGSRLTRWVRPAFAFPFVVYVNKLVIWDKVLGWGATDPLSADLSETMAIVIGAYFIARPFEKVGQAWANGKRQK